MYYFISDHHFGHTNIIKLQNRPFNNVYEMNLFMLNEWNNIITDNDIVFYLGDIMYKMNPNKFILDILNKLNGKICFIPGNHDKRFLQKYAYRFEWIEKYYEFEYDFNNKTYFFSLFHYPISSWNHMYKNGIHLHGHNHNIINYKEITNFKIMNVSVENLNYKPICINNVIKKLFF